MHIIIIICAAFLAGCVQLGSSSQIVVAWWGHHEHSLCQSNSTTNTIVCNPDDENTVASSQSTGWIEYILSENEVVSCCDIFSDCGKCYIA